MWDLVLVVAATAVAMLMLVAFASLLFRENRTREVRRPAAPKRPVATGPEDDPVWRTVVDPATHDAGAVRPFAVAYARAMTVPDAGSEMPGHRAA